MRFFRLTVGVLSVVLMLAAGMTQPLGAGRLGAQVKTAPDCADLIAPVLVDGAAAITVFDVVDDDLSPYERLRSALPGFGLMPWPAQVTAELPTIRPTGLLGRSPRLIGMVELRI